MSGLTIAAQSLDIEGAWKHNRSLRRLRSTIRTKGENGPNPGAAGSNAYPVLPAEVLVDMELLVYGNKDSAGVAHADTVEGLDENLAYLEDWVLSLADGATDTWTATLETSSGRTFETGVQVRNWQIMRDDTPIVIIGYDLMIPTGSWTETTP